MQPETGLSADENAGLLMHKLIRNPAGIADLLEALLPAAPIAQQPTDLTSRKRVS